MSSRFDRRIRRHPRLINRNTYVADCTEGGREAAGNASVQNEREADLSGQHVSHQAGNDACPALTM